MTWLNKTKLGIVAVFSHGSFGLVETVDGVEVNLHEKIIYQFDEDEFETMTGKPKMFILQMCQTFSESNATASDNQTCQMGRGVKNMIVCYPDIPDLRPCVRDIYLGSHFICLGRCLCEERA